MMICFYLANTAIMRDFYIYWCYSTFYMLIVSYRAYMGFIDYLCTYIPNREGKKEGTQTAGEEEHQQNGKRNRRKKHKINSA